MAFSGKLYMNSEMRSIVSEIRDEIWLFLRQEQPKIIKHESDIFFQDLEKFDGVGGWLNTENGQYYFDAVKVFRTRKDAEKYAQEQGQIAYFHLTTGTEIKTPPVTITGGIPSGIGFSRTNGVIVR